MVHRINDARSTCALTHATLDAIAADPGTRAVVRAMMVEAAGVGEKLGVRFGVDVDQRIVAAVNEPDAQTLWQPDIGVEADGGLREEQRGARPDATLEERHGHGRSK